METALVCARPVASRRRPTARRGLRLALGGAGMALVAIAALLQPFAANHLLPKAPGGRAGPPIGTAPLPSRVVTAAPDNPPAAAPHPEPAPVAVAPASPAPTATATKQAAEPPVVTPGSLPSATVQERPAPAKLPVPAPEPLPPAVAARPEPVAPPAAAAPAVARTVSDRLGLPPLPREPLPLQTDLINPVAPAEKPVAGSIEPSAPSAGGAAPVGKPGAGERHG